MACSYSTLALTAALSVSLKGTFKRTVAEANLVVLHCHQVWPTDANKDWAGIDIFRFDAVGKIIEHWDVLQVVPADARHENGMF